MKVILFLIALIIAILAAMLLSIPIIEWGATLNMKLLGFFLALAIVLSPVIIGLLPPRRIKPNANPPD
jgi:hypothetical protein